MSRIELEYVAVGWPELIHTAGVAGSNPASPTIFEVNTEQSGSMSFLFHARLT